MSLLINSHGPHRLYFRGQWREAAERWRRRGGREDSIPQVHFLHSLDGGLRAILLLWNEKYEFSILVGDPPFERAKISFLSAVLSLYLKYLFTGNGMKNDEAEDLATSLYHGFVFFCYFTSLFGAYLADSFLGKFKTIFYISIIYTIGQAVLSLGSFPDTECGIAGMPQE